MKRRLVAVKGWVGLTANMLMKMSYDYVLAVRWTPFPTMHLHLFDYRGDAVDPLPLRNLVMMQSYDSYPDWHWLGWVVGDGGCVQSCWDHWDRTVLNGTPYHYCHYSR